MWISQQEWTNRIFVTQLFACCERAPSLAASLHLSILQTAEVLSAACCLMLVHLCYATARLFFELVFSDSCLQLPHYPGHSCLQNVPDTTSAGPRFSSTNTSHLHRLWACHPALQWGKHYNSPSSRLSGPRGPTRSQHILGPFFGCLRSAVDTGSRRSLYGSKGCHCHFSLCVPLLTLGKDHSTKGVQNFNHESDKFTNFHITVL